MGAEWLQLFDRKLCDEIVSLDAKTLPTFVEQHADCFPELSHFRYGFNGVPAREPVRRIGPDNRGKTGHWLDSYVAFAGGNHKCWNAAWHQWRENVTGPDSAESKLLARPKNP